MDKQLGEGQFGVVNIGELLNASDQSLKTQIAIKSTKIGGDGHPSAEELTAAEELADEAVLTGSLNHDNIVRVLGVCYPLSARMMVLLEFCARGSLEGLLEAERLAGGTAASFGIPMLIGMLQDLASALGYLDSLGCVHRDAPLFLRRDFGFVFSTSESTPKSTIPFTVLYYCAKP